ncbi:hypothetical protein ATANTOWER_000359 [Ataeniobius toweri]|uniref:SEA domain-containing protein n=1 Tax=Ataeniobius toweri TaxID=208326 RepID=A0ABU7B3V4_9TELE|nr:hypothetical protein [Ataeniobius toweri]
MELDDIKTTSDQLEEMVDNPDGATNAGDYVQRLLPESNDSNRKETGNGDITENQNKKSQKNFFRKHGKWIAAIFLILLIALVITISVAVCFANNEDNDEKYDPSLFKLQQKFNGSFIVNLVQTSNKTQVLKDLQEKLADLYRSSPALGRFFSEAETFGLRSDSAVVQYKLTFVYPEEQQAELRNFTLSSEMVFNVFRQFLYDQSDVESETRFVDPSSLKMHTMH